MIRLHQSPPPLFQSGSVNSVFTFTMCPDSWRVVALGEMPPEAAGFFLSSFFSQFFLCQDPG